MLELVSFLSIKDTKCVEILLTPHFEFHHIFASLNLDGPRILSSSSEQEILDLGNLLRLQIEEEKKRNFIFFLESQKGREPTRTQEETRGMTWKRDRIEQKPRQKKKTTEEWMNRREGN